MINAQGAAGELEEQVFEADFTDGESEQLPPPGIFYQAMMDALERLKNYVPIA